MAFVYNCHSHRGSTIASEIIRIRDIASPSSTRLFIPFLGFAGVVQHLSAHFTDIVVSDSDPDVGVMWDAVIRKGWRPEDTCCEEQYEYLKTLRPGRTPRRGFYGRVCTMGRPLGPYRSSDNNYDYVEKGIEYLNSCRPLLRNMTIAPSRNYAQCCPKRGDTVFCNPPPETDMEPFFQKCRRWHQEGVLVLIMAREAPYGYVARMGDVINKLWVHSAVLDAGWRPDSDDPSPAESTPTSADPRCGLCEDLLPPDAAVYDATCCGRTFHSACLAMHLQKGHGTCPSCLQELWPDEEDDSSYVESSSDSDDHRYSEDDEGIDTRG